jgi:coiled-coil domain-containing protein 130
MQGFNMGRYVPPDLEGLTTGNALHNKSRRKPGGGQTVRFEMPFAIWCATCTRPTIIGQGVRFNAEKRRVGNYYSTPIWSFTFQHAECGGEIEIRTDPKNTAYVVERGARKRETGEDEAKDGDVLVMSAEEREKLRQNAFAGLEKTIEDREQLRAAAGRLDELEGASSRFWDDPYTKNQILRKTFREERKKLEKESAATQDLKDKMSLSIDLLPATEMDSMRASLVDFGASEDSEPPNRALAKPLFPAKPSRKQNAVGGESQRSKDKARKLKSEILASKRKESLVSEIIGNTRIARDPFLDGRKALDSISATKFAGVKRKKSPLEDCHSPQPSQKQSGTSSGSGSSSAPTSAAAAGTSGLVSYDSE